MQSQCRNEPMGDYLVLGILRTHSYSYKIIIGIIYPIKNMSILVGNKDRHGPTELNAFACETIV